MRNNKEFRWLSVITGLFVAVLLISNLASTKILDFGAFTFDGGTLIFPLSYIFGDVLTEVYGYKRSRKVIWTGFFSAALMSITLGVVAILPPNTEWVWQEAFTALFGMVPRIIVGSLVAYFVGEFVNSYIMSKMKIMTKGKYLWLRTIGSTILGEGFDTIIFVTIAFWGTMSTEVITAIIISNYVFKVGVEILFTPITYKVSSFLKKSEDIDYYDTNTNYNPFLISSE